jgi:hypothetical protein
MGIEELSMNSPSVPIIKHLIRHVKSADAKEVLTAALSMEDTNEIEELMDERVSLVLNDLSDDTPAISRSRASRPPSTALKLPFRRS